MVMENQAVNKAGVVLNRVVRVGQVCNYSLLERLSWSLPIPPALSSHQITCSCDVYYIFSLHSCTCCSVCLNAAPPGPQSWLTPTHL